MPNEREDFFYSVTPIEYDIAGNVFSAYYDADNRLIFVVDYTVSDIKPNALLVINPVDDRKWDDILENDYDVDLETVRPKKDNKYQKLDIEYSGLNKYENLINVYMSGGDVAGALYELGEFINAAAYHAAQERLADATVVAERASDTIDKTNEKIAELQSYIKELRSKLTDARREIGKQPTKQSASKILRLESQIELNNDKLKRAKKRLANAQKRLDSANKDIYVAQEILEKLDVNLPAQPLVTDVAPIKTAPVPTNITSSEYTNETKADDMADEDVKPLFDKDPEILDEEIAFKPVEFDGQSGVPAPFVTPGMSVPVDEDIEPAPVADDSFETVDIPYVQESEQETVTQPLSFAPPSSFETVDVPAVPEEQHATPMLDGFTSFPDVEETPTQDWAPAPTVTPEEKPLEDVLAPVVPAEPIVSDVVPDAVPAPITSDVRPVSPVSGAAVAPVDAGVSARGKPTMLYYVLLIILIVMSVFTLWFYQKSSSDNTPELAAVAEPEVMVVEQEFTPEEQPDVEPEPVAVVEPEPVIDDSIEPEPVVPTPAVIVPDVEPVAVEVTEPVVETVAEPVPVTPEPVPEDVTEQEPVIENPFIDLPANTIVGPVPGVVVEEEPVVVPTEEEVLASKPAYGASARSDEMFVAAPEYETDTVVVTEPASVVMTEPQIVSGPQYVETVQETVMTEAENVCAGGSLPDKFGCCPGEEFVLLPDGEQACCAESTGECFPPM